MYMIMKNYVILGLMVVVSLPAIGQEKFTTYKMLYLNENFEIRLYSKKNDFSLYIFAKGYDNLYSNGGFIVEKDQYSSFVETINDAKEKYIKWVKTAKENNVRKVTKTMNGISTNISGFFQYGDEWKFTNYQPIIYSFLVMENNAKKLDYLLLLSSYKMKSKTNEYINVKGFYIAFSSVAEIDNFLNLISLENIDKFIKAPKTEDLFK